jgi:hypothetical protein
MDPKDLAEAYKDALNLLSVDSTCIYDCSAYTYQPSRATGHNQVGWISRYYDKLPFLGPGQTWIKDRCTIVDTPWSVFSLEHWSPPNRTTGPMRFSVWTDYTCSIHNGPITEVVLRAVKIPDWKNHVEIIGSIFANAAVQSYGTLGWTMHVPTHERLAMYIAYCSVYANTEGWDESGSGDGFLFENRPAADVPWCDPAATGRPAYPWWLAQWKQAGSPDIAAQPTARITYFPNRTGQKKAASKKTGSKKQRLLDFMAGPKRKR